MIKFTTSGSTLNKVVFYTPSNVGIQEGEEVYLEFTSEANYQTSSLQQEVAKKYPKYLQFNISSSQIPQQGGYYKLALKTDAKWEDVHDNWEDTLRYWTDVQYTIDEERAYIFEPVVSESFFTGSMLEEVESVAIVQEDINNETYSYLVDEDGATFFNFDF